MALMFRSLIGCLLRAVAACAMGMLIVMAMAVHHPHGWVWIVLWTNALIIASSLAVGVTFVVLLSTTGGLSVDAGREMVSISSVWTVGLAFWMWRAIPVIWPWLVLDLAVIVLAAVGVQRLYRQRL